MIDTLRISQILLASIVVVCQGCVTADVEPFVSDAGAGIDARYDQQTFGDDTRFEKFAVSAAQPLYTIDHAPWAEFLAVTVIDAGPSSRQGAARRTGGVHTGTRISTGSRSKYRFEANRVLFHLFNNDTREFISTYRAAITGLMDQYEYSDFGRDEQLAFWLNLHNAILFEEIAKRHPISRPRNIRVRSHGDALLFDAKLVVVAGEPLSLNDIRHRIVYANWSEPEIVYGFWDGTIGGVDIQTNAFTGANVWTQLRANGRRYVNSLRGVEPFPGNFGRVHFRVSRVFWDVRGLFPDWPHDLYAELDSYAGVSVGRLLKQPPPLLRPVRYDASTADFGAGETARFGGSDNIAAVLSLGGDEGNDPDSSGTAVNILENFGAPVQNATSRGGVSPDALKLRDQVFEDRRRQREGSVTLEDVDTPDTDEAPAPDSSEDRPDAVEKQN